MGFLLKLKVMNLTSVAKFIRKSAKYLILVVVGYYVLILVAIPGSKGIIKAILFPKQPPNPIYGQLNPLEFTEKPITNDEAEFVLNTQNGKLPTDLPSTMKVYKFKPQQFSYLAGKNAIADAETLGFTEKDLITDLKGSVFKWRNSELETLLTIGVDTKRLDLNTNMSQKSIYYTPGNIDEQSAKTIGAELFLSLYRFDSELYKTGVQKVKLGKISGNRIIESIDKREAQVALVDFYRFIGEYPILGPNPEKGMLRCVIKNPARINTPLNNPMVEASYWDINSKSTAIYPIISVKDAWGAVSTGRGVIVNVTPKGTNPFDDYIPTRVDTILIDNVFMAYYETTNYQEYLQPIFVFRGTYTSRGTGGGYITLYFPAVTGEYTKQTTQP